MDDVEALRMARVQLQVRHAQLSSCRVCGVEAQKYQEAIERIRQIEATYRGEQHHELPIQ